MKKAVFIFISIFCSQLKASDCVFTVAQITPADDKTAIDALISQKVVPSDPLENFLSQEALAAADSKIRHNEAMNLSKVVWYFDGSIKKGIYKRSNTSRFFGDVIEVIADPSGEKKPLKQYPAGTRIESFNISPDNKTLVVILIKGDFIENKDQYSYSQDSNISDLAPQTKSAPFAVSIDVIDLQTQKDKGEILLREMVSRIAVEGRSGERTDIFNAITMTNNAAILEPKSWAFSTWATLVSWNGQGKIEHRPLFKERGPGMAMQSHTYQLTVSQDGHIIAATADLFSSSKRSMISGVAIRNLKTDPIIGDDSLFEPKHIILKFSDIGFNGVNLLDKYN
jgi:hypothetical protein